MFGGSIIENESKFYFWILAETAKVEGVKEGLLERLFATNQFPVRDTHSITSALSSLLPPSLVNIIEE